MMNNPKILLVDDDEDILFVNKIILSEANFDIDTSNDPEDALMKCKSKDHDMFILDYMMPKMKGDELARRIIEYKKSQGLPANIVFLTGLVEFVNFLKNVGGISNLVLGKPIGAHDLIEAIRSRINQPLVICA